MVSAPNLRDLMTPAPVTVDLNRTLACAERLMTEHVVRHLPVMDGETLVGILSHRDVYLALSQLKLSSDETFVKQVYVEYPFRADVNDSLEKVLRDMLSLQIGSALVLEDEKLAGIVTTYDVTRAFVDLLGTLSNDTE